MVSLLVGSLAFSFIGDFDSRSSIGIIFTSLTLTSRFFVFLGRIKVRPLGCIRCRGTLPLPGLFPKVSFAADDGFAIMLPCASNRSFSPSAFGIGASSFQVPPRDLYASTLATTVMVRRNRRNNNNQTDVIGKANMKRFHDLVLYLPFLRPLWL